MPFARVDIQSQGRKLATYRQKGEGRFGVFIAAGHRSLFTGNKKWLALADTSADAGLPVTGFDYAGYGNSEGEPEQYWRLDQWLPNALDAFDAVADRPQIIVGSSMGGWLAVALAMLRPQKVAGLFLLAPGFGSYIAKTGKTTIDLPEGKDSIHLKMADDGRHQILGPVDVFCPLLCLHGLKDDKVSYKTSIDLIGLAKNPMASAQILKDVTHRFDSPAELALIQDEFREFYSVVEKQNG